MKMSVLAAALFVSIGKLLPQRLSLGFASNIFPCPFNPFLLTIFVAPLPPFSGFFLSPLFFHCGCAGGFAL